MERLLLLYFCFNIFLIRSLDGLTVQNVTVNEGDTTLAPQVVFTNTNNEFNTTLQKELFNKKRGDDGNDSVTMRPGGILKRLEITTIERVLRSSSAAIRPRLNEKAKTAAFLQINVTVTRALKDLPRLKTKQRETALLEDETPQKTSPVQKIRPRTSKLYSSSAIQSEPSSSSEIVKKIISSRTLTTQSPATKIPTTKKLTTRRTNTTAEPTRHHGLTEKEHAMLSQKASLIVGAVFIPALILLFIFCRFVPACLQKLTDEK